MSIPRMYNVWEVATYDGVEHHIIHHKALPPAIPQGAVLIHQVFGNDRTTAKEAFDEWQARIALAASDLDRKLWEEEQYEAFDEYIDTLPPEDCTTGLYETLADGLQAELDYAESEAMRLQFHNDELLEELALTDQIISKLRGTIEEQQNTIEMLKHRVDINEEAAQKFEALATHLEETVNRLTDGDIASA